MSGRKNLFILTGAGFSMPYLKYEGESLSSKFICRLLTEKELFDCWWSRINSSKPPEEMQIIQKLSIQIWKLLNEEYKNPFCLPGFEMILYLLHIHCQYVNEHNNNEQIKTMYLHKILSKPLNSEIKFSYRDFYQFRNFILDVVACFEADEKDICKLHKWIERLKEYHNLQLYTLNYDNLLLSAIRNRIDLRESDCMPNSENDFNVMPEDFNFGVDWNDKLIPSKILNNKDGVSHCYFHLHGSVNYGRSDGSGAHTFCFYSNKFCANKGRESYISHKENTGELLDSAPIIASYEKEKALNIEPYNSIHIKMTQDLLSADEIWLIGYSFTDEHINSKIRSCIAANKNAPKIKIINTESAKSEIELPGGRWNLLREETGENIPPNFENVEFKYCGTEKFIDS